MLYVGVVKAFQYIGCELLQFFDRQVQCLHQFVKLYFADILAYNRVVASVAHDVYAAKVSHRRKYGVRTVQQGNLSFVVRSLRLHKEHIQSCLVCGEFFCQLAEREVLGSFDNPQMEDFGLYNQVVGITDFLLNLRNLLTREARNDAVYQSGAYITILCKPSLELLIICTEVVFPQFDVLVDTFFQMVSVQED